ncbi:hypothetical protein [Undibacterium sp. Ji49W]|uniref:hypothetical protein n=1 Tax=Undibacterium sp. Ji49W TaxID=3413040 RepID=UPI003BF2212F
MIKVTQLQFEYVRKRVYDDFSHGGSVEVLGYPAIPWGCVFKQYVVQRGERRGLPFTHPTTEGAR